jgi:secreted PhoX family phosphatase
MLCTSQILFTQRSICNLGEILAFAYIDRMIPPIFMPDVDSSEVKENVESIESRRKFLKISVAAGAAAAALAAGVHFLPNLSSPGNESQSKVGFENSSVSGQALVLVIRDGHLDVYEGENKYTSNDLSFARSISASVRARM